MKDASAFHGEQGFWMMHSVPGLKLNDKYPSTGVKLSQHIMCITFNKKYLKTLIEYFYTVKPKIHSANYPPDYWTNEYLRQIAKNEFEESEKRRVKKKKLRAPNVLLLKKTIP